MSTHANPKHATPVVQVILSGKERIVRDFGPDKNFRAALAQVLLECGMSGTFTAIVEGRIKGGPHAKGLQLGLPNTQRRSVEIRWQSGGNDARYSLQVVTPYGMEPEAFYAALEKRLGKIKDASSTAEKADQGAHDTSEPTPLQSTLTVVEPTPLTNEAITLFFEEAVAKATNAGVIPREVCIDILTRLDRMNCEADIVALIAGGDLKPGKVASLLIIGDKWLRHVRTAPTLAVVTQPAETSPVGKEEKEAPSLPRDLLSEVVRLSQIVEGAKQHGQALSALRKEIAELESEIERAQARLSSARSEFATLQAVVTDPSTAQAEETLASLRKILIG